MKRVIVPAFIAVVGLAISGCSVPTTTGSAGDKAKTVSTTNAAAKPKPAAANPKAPAKSAAKPVSYKGHGDKVLKITKPETGAVVVDLTHDGSENFIVTPIEGATEGYEGGVNVIGRYKGRVLLDGDGDTESNKLKIQANGDWTVKISPVSVVETFAKSYAGKGDNVIAYTGKAGTIAMTHKGQGNFIVSSTNDMMGLANEIGNYKGETTISDGPSILSITSDGTWTLKVTED